MGTQPLWSGPRHDSEARRMHGSGDPTGGSHQTIKQCSPSGRPGPLQSGPRMAGAGASPATRGSWRGRACRRVAGKIRYDARASLSPASCGVARRRSGLQELLNQLLQRRQLLAVHEVEVEREVHEVLETRVQVRLRVVREPAEVWRASHGIKSAGPLAENVHACCRLPRAARPPLRPGCRRA